MIGTRAELHGRSPRSLPVRHIYTAVRYRSWFAAGRRFRPAATHGRPSPRVEVAGHIRPALQFGGGRCILEIFEILDGQLYQSGAPEDAAEWTSVRSRGIDVVVDLFGSLDPGVPVEPNSILYIYWPIEDAAALPAMGILNVLVDATVRLIRVGHKVLVHCHRGKSRSGLFNALVVMQMLGISGADAVEFVRSQRPGALGNEVFTAYLRSQPAPAPAGP
jgi:protein-tyrosine phosphatase